MPLVLGAAVVAVVGAGAILMKRADAMNNKVALASSPKPVSVTAAAARSFQGTRAYVGALEPWLAASVGPQLISSFVDTVLVRPGAVVKRGEVLATLDCRDTSAANQAVASEARAIDARQKAIASEAARLRTLLAGNFVSANEAEQKAAQSAASEAELAAMRAKLTRKSLEVDDCVLRAPFDGEVATRAVDPGAFVRPGAAVVSLVDRSTVRLVADAPEVDFEVVAPGREARIAITATKKELVGIIARRGPAADPATRTVRFEIDLADTERRIPVGTTGEVRLAVGHPIPATVIPIRAANVRGKKAVLFVVEGDVAHAKSVAVIGESGADLFVSPDLPPGALVVTEGRGLLADGDRVSAKLEGSPSPKPEKGPTP
ncbi:Putative Co/Zn/Cd efflux system membrane fusion protein [Minicystis rosea]|nr:Putative Co/Zn/Cd efflux system membrane fusion protein [Minicystis rosea]